MYIDRTGFEINALVRRGLCGFCEESHVGSCRARFCNSCTQMWIADTPADLSDGRPQTEDCPACRSEGR